MHLHNIVVIFFKVGNLISGILFASKLFCLLANAFSLCVCVCVCVCVFYCLATH